MFLEAIKEALAFSAFMIGMPVVLAFAFDLVCRAARRWKEGRRV